MNVNVDSLTVTHNEARNRFEIQLNDMLARLAYIPAKNNILYIDTQVPSEFEGQGIGSKLAHFALEYAKENGLKVQPLCPFISAYVRRHPEYNDIVW